MATTEQTEPQKTVLFVDYQNMYKGARDAFFHRRAYFTEGQFDPWAMGELICSRPPPGTTRILKEVLVYCGRPSASHNPTGYRANKKQCSVWKRSGIEVITRPLLYVPGEKPKEKGIDVQLAVDYIAYAASGIFDVGIIASRDTDLIPSLDFVLEWFRDRRVEVAGWSGTGRQLQPDNRRIWCHWLNANDYQSIADPTNYTL